MANIPKSGKSDERSASDGAPAVDYVRTKQEAEAEVTKREAEAELAKASRKDNSSPTGNIRKHHSDEPTDTAQEASSEPIVEDEP
jgi:hypothetical protein